MRISGCTCERVFVQLHFSLESISACLCVRQLTEAEPSLLQVSIRKKKRMSETRAESNALLRLRHASSSPQSFEEQLFPQPATQLSLSCTIQMAPKIRLLESVTAHSNSHQTLGIVYVLTTLFSSVCPKKIDYMVMM